MFKIRILIFLVNLTTTSYAMGGNGNLAVVHGGTGPGVAPNGIDLSLENSNPGLAAQNILKRSIYPTIKAHKQQHLKSAQIFIRSEDGCQTYPCLRAVSHALQKSGYFIDAQKIGTQNAVYVLTIRWKEKL